MAFEVLTRQDLLQFKTELLQELRQCLKPEPAKKWLKTSEVRKRLQVSPGTLQTLRTNGTLRYSRIGNIIYYDADYIDQLLRQNLVNPQNNRPCPTPPPSKPSSNG